MDIITRFVWQVMSTRKCNLELFPEVPPVEMRVLKEMEKQTPEMLQLL